MIKTGDCTQSVSTFSSADQRSRRGIYFRNGVLRLMPPEPAPVDRPILISILIVNYRTYEELASCLDSLRAFLADDIEVIVVDHSSDAVAAGQLARRFPWMQLVAVNANPGFAAGVNRGARAAAGHYFLLLNPDSSVDGDVAHSLAAWLEEYAQVAVAGGLVRESDGSIQASARRFPNVTTGFAGRTSWLTRVWPSNFWTRRNLVAREDRRDPIEVDWVSGACMMIRREAFEAVGGMDEQFFLYWEDADLCFRLRRAGWLTVYHPAIGITHLTGRSSATAKKQSLIAFHRSAFRYFFKHGGRFSKAVSPIVFLALYARLFLKIAALQLNRNGAR
jgi:GT2 family glycosyltransferase